ncbi:hypothetical protein ACJ73_08185 [Blastomyces percursus]|uniref:Uncharacterized protein n=1 Tax=Blastomyces percursus TaxID=1658174 RepID=A0A1J9PW16_9EURO|nr:hypothetical protein ACJ73_08185 [Blastomyces percursus]
MGSDRAYIERVIAIRAEFKRLGFNLPDYIFFDRLLYGVTKGWATFIRNRMDEAAKNVNAPPIEDDFMGLCRDILLRLSASVTSSTARDSRSQTHAVDSVKREDSARCSHCEKPCHDEKSCWIKHPGKCPPWARRDRKGASKNKKKNDKMDKSDTDSSKTMEKDDGSAPIHNIVEKVFHVRDPRWGDEAFWPKTPAAHQSWRHDQMPAL